MTDIKEAQGLDVVAWGLPDETKDSPRPFLVLFHHPKQAGCPELLVPLIELDKAQAVIDQLRADRSACWAEFKVMTKACLDAEKERDQLRAELAYLKAYKLPCDVRLPPATKIGKGCPLDTLLKSLSLREGVAPELIQFPDKPNKKAGERWDELNSKRCMVCGEFHGNPFMPCPKTIPMSIKT